MLLHIASMEWVAALWVGSNNQVSLKNQCKFSCQLYSYCLEISFALNFTEIKELKNYLYHQEYGRYAKVHKQAFPTELNFPNQDGSIPVSSADKAETRVWNIG